MRYASILAALGFGALMLAGCAPPRADHPVIGAKNFTEQVVLGELLAQEIEAKSNLKVERRDRTSTRLNSSHLARSRMPSSA